MALANEGGGKIVLGVTDRRPRRVVGTAAFDEPGRTEAGLHQRLSHRIPVEEKGLDRGTNKALLLQHIQNNAALGSKMKEFIQVLPALPRSQIQVLLRELAAEQAAHIIGIKNGARWYPGLRAAGCQLQPWRSGFKSGGPGCKVSLKSSCFSTTWA